MATIYAKNKLTGEWERVGPAAAATDATLTLSGSPADAKVTGDAIKAVQDTVSSLTAEDVGALPADTEIPSIEGLASEAYVDEKLTEVIGGAPELLNTLDELSAALNDDENFATTVSNQIAEKQDKLTFDETPTEGSVNPVTSGGIKSYVDSAQVQSDLSQTDDTAVDYVKGVLRTEHLPEGYPYKEKSETVIEWDGNTEGLPTYDGTTYHVSDKIPSNDDLRNLSLVASNGMELAMDESAWNSYVSSGAVKDDYAFLLNHLVVVTRVPNVRYNNITFVEPGVYLGVNEGLYIAKLTYSTETIHPMAPEFLPYEYAQVSYVDEQLSTQLATKQNTITGTAGQFVVIGDDGNVTTKTIANAEGSSY